MNGYIIDPILNEEIVNGIIIPDMAQKPINKGTILIVSDQMKKDEIKVGDVVMFSSYAATKIEDNNKTLFIVRKHDIIAIL